MPDKTEGYLMGLVFFLLFSAVSCNQSKSTGEGSFVEGLNADLAEEITASEKNLLTKACLGLKNFGLTGPAQVKLKIQTQSCEGAVKSYPLFMLPIEARSGGYYLTMDQTQPILNTDLLLLPTGVEHPFSLWCDDLSTGQPVMRSKVLTNQSFIREISLDESIGAGSLELCPAKLTGEVAKGKPICVQLRDRPNTERSSDNGFIAQEVLVVNSDSVNNQLDTYGLTLFRERRTQVECGNNSGERREQFEILTFTMNNN